MPHETPSQRTVRVHVAIHGLVQGVGFRPFVWRLALKIGLTGWVNNSAEGVFIEAEGHDAMLREFLRRLESDKPEIALIQSLEATFLDPVGFAEFEIRPSSAGDKRGTLKALSGRFPVPTTW